jgi:hypothetical protein
MEQQPQCSIEYIKKQERVQARKLTKELAKS